MSLMPNTQWLIVASCLFASACTEKTIIREVPATGAVASIDSDTTAETTTETTTETTSPLLLDQSEDNAANIEPTTPTTPEPPLVTTLTPNMIDGIPVTSNPTTTDTPQTNNGNLVPITEGSELLADPITTDPVVDSSDPVVPTPVTSDPAPPSTIGSPGLSVDCQQTLPCSWVSADTHFTVTISNADNIGAQGNLSVEYSILTTHDTEISIASTEPAMDDIGIRYEPSALALGEGIGGTAQGVFGGSKIYASIEYDRASSASTLASWTIGLSDAGLVRQPKFSGIPIGSATTQVADCENTLPCAWASPAGDTTITLLSATGFGSTNRLSTNFKIETTRNTVVAIESGSTAVGVDGLTFEGRTHAIGVDTGAEKMTANSIAGAQVAGTVFFFRTQSMSPTLQILSLKVYEDRPVPRWNPSFISVPVQ